MAEATPAADAAAIAAAARLLEAGELVALPTETVYGLGADAENPQAVAKIYAAKGRPPGHPLIVHIAPEADINHWAQDIPPEARALAAAFWPGPLTIILKRNPAIPAAVAGGQDSIGLRCPAHPVALALLRAFKDGQGGIAAPSANRFGHVSPTTAQHVREEFDLSLCVLEGGQSDVGIESTIVDLTRLETLGPVLLRPGRLSTSELARVMGRPLARPDAAAPRVSGSLEAHYAPMTPLVLVSEDELSAVLSRLALRGKRVALITLLPTVPDGVAAACCMAPDAAGYAHALYASLRELDQIQADLIVVQAPPSGPQWDAVNDRLRRAAHDSRGVLERLAGI
jgi:L-threonylcarbamoyladenylate synthase